MNKELKDKINLVCEYVEFIGFNGYELLELSDEIKREDEDE